jgi:hypothetical protein
MLRTVSMLRLARAALLKPRKFMVGAKGGRSDYCLRWLPIKRALISRRLHKIRYFHRSANFSIAINMVALSRWP